MRSMLLAVLLALWGVAAHASPTLVDFATVSMTNAGLPRTVTDTVCVSDGRDLTCDRGVYITSNSRVGIGSNSPQAPLYVALPSATSGLTNSAGSNNNLTKFDQNIDGLNYSVFDLTTRRHTSGFGWGGTNVRYQRTVDVTPMGFIDFGIDGNFDSYGLGFGTGSATHVVIERYGHVGIGTKTPRSKLVVHDESVAGIDLSIDGKNNSDQIYFNFITKNGSVGTLGISDTKGWHLSARGDKWTNSDDSPNDLILVGFEGNMSRRVLTANLHSGNIGIGYLALSPSATLHVGGSVRLAEESSATMAVCDANRTGAIRYTGGDFWFCRNGSAWESMAILSGGGGLADRIVSGTSAVVVNSATGIVSISQLGAVASYVHPSMGYVGPGVSTTGTVSGTKVATNVVKFSGIVGSCATADDEGSFTYDATRKRLQICKIY